MDYKNWNKGEPNNYKGEDCGTYSRSKHFVWNDYGCNKTKPYVCKYGGEPPKADAPLDPKVFFAGERRGKKQSIEGEAQTI